MKIVRGEDHRLHFPEGELCGGELVRPYDCPERWDHIMQRLPDQGLRDVDTFEKDPISFFRLGNDDFSAYGERLARLRIPTLFIVDGEYAVAEIGVNMVNVLTGYLQG